MGKNDFKKSINFLCYLKLPHSSMFFNVFEAEWLRTNRWIKLEQKQADSQVWGGCNKLKAMVCNTEWSLWVYETLAVQEKKIDKWGVQKENW